jgi:hypothetical protein
VERIGLRATTRRLAVGAAALLVTIGALAPGPAIAQFDCVADPADPACVRDETSTTVDGGGIDDATTTTEPEPERTTTTVRRTTTTEAPDDVAVVEEEEEEVTEAPATTLPRRPALLVPGPPLVEPAPVAPEIAQERSPDPAGEPLDADPPSSGGDDTTRRMVILAIAGLLVTAMLLGTLTWWYWRRTEPAAPVTPPPATPASDPSARRASTGGALAGGAPAGGAPAAVDGSTPTRTGPALDRGNADWHEEHVRPPMAPPPGRVTDRAR